MTTSMSYDDDDVYDDWDDEEDEEYYPRDDWEDISLKIEVDFHRAQDRFDHPREHTNPLIWWMPIDGWPEGVVISEESDTEDMWSNGQGGVRAGYLGTILVERRIYMERPRQDGWGWANDPEQFRIFSYMQKWVDERPVLAAVLSAQPPPWGIWLPTLKEVNW